jgi:hypothetical protein
MKRMAIRRHIDGAGSGTSMIEVRSQRKAADYGKLID